MKESPQGAKVRSTIDNSLSLLKCGDFKGTHPEVVSPLQQQSNLLTGGLCGCSAQLPVLIARRKSS